MKAALKQLSQNRYIPVFGIFVATLLVYSQTLTIPWYFDDIPVIVDNSALRDLGARLTGFFAPRGPVDLTFALNFQLHGIQITGYHIVNLAIHLANGILLNLLLRRIFRGNPLAHYAALTIFLLHPLQTQAINYVVQRYTLAAAFCGLASLLLTAWWAEDCGFPFRSPRAVCTYLAALFFGALSVLCKQNMAFLFLVIPLFCSVANDGAWSKKDSIRYLAIPFAVMPLWEGLRQLVIPLISGTSLDEISGFLPSSGQLSEVSPLLYCVTQWKVFWLYLRLLVLPYNQALDYGYPLATEVVTYGNLAALAGLCALFFLAWTVRKKYPVTSFGIAWFFIFLLVESTLIPLDPVFEHRLYLPLVGFAIVAADCLSRITRPKLRYGIVVAVALLLVIPTWQRNTLWLSPSALLTDNVEKYPGNPRIYAGAANALATEGSLQKARELLQQGFRRGLRHEAMYISLINILVAEGNIQEAIQTGEEGLTLYPKAENILYLTGMAEDLRGNHPRAEQYFMTAIKLYPEKEQAYGNLGTSFNKQGRWEEAAATYRKAVAINPLYSIGHYNLGIALYNLKRPVEAVEELRISYRLGGNVDVLCSLIALQAEIGNRAAAEMSLNELDAIAPAKGKALRTQLQW